VPLKSPLAAPDGGKAAAGLCQFAAVLDVAVSTWPALGAVAVLVTTLVVADLMAVEVATVGFGYVPLRSPPAAPVGVALGVDHTAVDELVAVRTCPLDGATAAEVTTVVVADFIPAEASTVGFGYVPLRSPPAGPDGGNEVAGLCHAAAVPDVAVSTWPDVGAIAADVITLVLADFSAAAVETVGFG